MDEKLKRHVFITDTHDPFRDMKAHELMLLILADLKPHGITLGSDGIDCYSISQFDKNPTRLKARNLQEEIDTHIARTKEVIAAAPGATLTWIPGNHEDRLRCLLWKNEALAGLDVLTWPVLLQFKQLGITEADGGEHMLNPRLVLKHGKLIRKDSAYSARAELDAEKYSITTLTGHTHRGGVYYARTRRGLVAAYECFCLCELEPEYVTRPNWQQGITVIWHSNEDNFFRVEPIPFIQSGDRLRAVFMGKEYHVQ